MTNSDEEVRELFDKTADSYEKRSISEVFNFSSLIFRRRMDIVENYLNIIPEGGKALDFGMGPGVFAKFCVDRRLHFTGIDISPEMVKKAIALKLSNAEYFVGDLTSLEKYQNSMDAVLAIGLLDYLDDPVHGIEMLANCVKEYGYLILSFRNRYSVPRMLRDGLKAIWKLLARRSSDPSRKAFFAEVNEHSFSFSRELRPKLNNLGFDNYQVGYFNFSPFFFNFTMPKPIWQIWYRFDSLAAGTLSRVMCSGGVMVAQRIIK